MKVSELKRGEFFKVVVTERCLGEGQIFMKVEYPNNKQVSVEIPDLPSLDINNDYIQAVWISEDFGTLCFFRNEQEVESLDNIGMIVEMLSMAFEEEEDA